MNNENVVLNNGIESASTSIRVNSLWKVFGRNPERVLDPLYAEKDRSFFQSEFGNVVGLQDVSFEVGRGQTFVIMGLSGSGKSTLVRCLIRLIEPTAGEIIIDGEDVTKMSDVELSELRRKKIAMVFQHYGLMPHRNVLDNAAWGLEVQGIEQGRPVCPRPRSAGPRRPHRLGRFLPPPIVRRDATTGGPDPGTGGRHRNSAYGRAVQRGLDPLIRRQMQDELLRLQEELQKTIVFITHDLNEALKLGDRIAILHDGRVAQIGSPEDIVLRPEDEYVGDFTQDVRLETVLTASKVMVTPKATLMGHQGPRAALHTIAGSDGDAAWIVDRKERYIGLLSIAKAERALRAGVTRLDQAWDYVDREYQAVTPATTFDQLITMALGSDSPHSRYQ